MLVLSSSENSEACRKVCRFQLNDVFRRVWLPWLSGMPFMFDVMHLKTENALLYRHVFQVIFITSMLLHVSGHRQYVCVVVSFKTSSLCLPWQSSPVCFLKYIFVVTYSRPFHHILMSSNTRLIMMYVCIAMNFKDLKRNLGTHILNELQSIPISADWRPAEFFCVPIENVWNHCCTPHRSSADRRLTLGFCALIRTQRSSCTQIVVRRSTTNFGPLYTAQKIGNTNTKCNDWYL